jgi:hypothetical protein
VSRNDEESSNIFPIAKQHHNHYDSSMKHLKLPHPVVWRQRIWMRVCFDIVMILLLMYFVITLGRWEAQKRWSQAEQLYDKLSQVSGSVAVVPRFQEIVQDAIKPTIYTGDLSVSIDQITPIVMGASSMSDMRHQVRRLLIQQLMDQWFTGRVVHPRVGTTNNMLTSIGTGTYDIRYPVESTDSLDTLLQDLIDRYAVLPLDPALRTNVKTEEIIVREWDWRERSDIYLFKNTTDLQDLGYEIVSHRTRVNRDKDYRRFNIMTAFAKMGNVLVLNPWQSLQYLRDIEFDNGPRKNYQYGLSIIGDEEIKDYGGGICGSSTALYQGILTNLALDITKRRAHTRRYSDLYPATINWQYIDTPGNDSALYGPSLDLHLTNIRPYPVIIVANYDGSAGGMEEVFSLAYSGDRGSIEFVSSYKTSAIDSTNGSTLRGWCYIWSINGEERKSCYKKVQ